MLKDVRREHPANTRPAGPTPDHAVRSYAVGAKYVVVQQTLHHPATTSQAPAPCEETCRTNAPQFGHSACPAKSTARSTGTLPTTWTGRSVCCHGTRAAVSTAMRVVIGPPSTPEAKVVPLTNEAVGRLTGPLRNRWKRCPCGVAVGRLRKAVIDQSRITRYHADGHRR